MSAHPVFGPSIGQRHVKAAVQGTIEAWIETYLAWVERSEGLDPRSLLSPADYALRDDGALSKRPEEQLPTICVLCPGTANDPEMESEGLYRAPFLVNVAAIVESSDPDFVADLADYYAEALRDLLVHNGSLGGFAQTTVWKGSRTDELRPEGSRSIAAAVNVFHVYVTGVVQKGAGLKAPPADPYEEIELPEITEVDVDLKPKEIDEP